MIERYVEAVSTYAESLDSLVMLIALIAEADLALDGNHLVIGANGSAFVYDISANEYVAELQPNELIEDLFFGASVAISGSKVAVGAEGDATNGERAGAVYVFDFENMDMDPPSDEVVVRVSSIEPGVFVRGRRGKAEVTVEVEDTLGMPVANAQVTVQIFGDISQVITATTNASGTVRVRSRQAAFRPLDYTACVLNVVADIPYDEQENIETCDSRGQ